MRLAAFSSFTRLAHFCIFSDFLGVSFQVFPFEIPTFATLQTQFFPFFFSLQIKKPEKIIGSKFQISDFGDMMSKFGPSSAVSAPIIGTDRAGTNLRKKETRYF